VNTESIVRELEATRDRLNQAIAALQGNKSLRLRVGITGGRKGRYLSAAARKRISEGMKQRWAARRKQGKKKEAR
jgi:hypothetical protein